MWLDRGHNGMDESLLQRGRVGLIVLRQPEQRILSGYWQKSSFCPPQAHHRCPGLHSYGHGGSGVGADGNFHVISELEYAKAVQGCAVRMLTRPGQSCGRPPLPSNAEVTEAITRLRRRFAFVGLLEEWELSICLLHVRFGLGLCEAVEMSNTRPGPMASRSNTTHRHSGYNVSVLRGFTDPYDGPLYQEAQVIFRAQLDEYNVTKELCQELRCWPVMK